MIEFVHPWMLLGLPVAALPILIHLFHRKRARPHPFAAIDFVLRSERRTARRLRLRRILLFAVRTLLLLALPLALARPQARRADARAVALGPAATAFVLDASLSMTYVQSGRSLFERARDRLNASLAATSADDPVTFLGCTARFEPPASPTFDRGLVRRQIDEQVPTFAPADLTRCLGAAARALAESPLRQKRLVVATDFTAAAFHLEIPPPFVRTPEGDVRPEVVLLDAADAPLPNRAITDLRIEPAPAVGHRAFQFTFTVRNFSPEPLKDLTALLRVGGQVVAKGFLDLGPRAAAQKTLVHPFPKGGAFEGRVEIAADALAADDARPFAIRVPPEVRVLVVNGAPSAVRYRDEAFFVETALGAPGTPVVAALRDVESVADEPFANYDVVFLLNVRAFPRAAELGPFVEAGGGLFVSLGDQVDADRYDPGLAALLPRPLHLVKTAGERGAGRGAARFGTVDFGHPVFSVFIGEARTGLLAARTFKYFLLQPGTDAVKVVAAYDDGAPALAEASRGRGRILVYTSTVDRDWSDWPIQPSFLPVLQRVAAYLAGALDEREARSVLVGEPAALVPPPGVEPLAAVAPDGRERPVKKIESGYAVEDTSLPGVYRVRGRALKGPDRELPELAFAVQVDPRESDLTRLEPEELVAHFGAGTRTESGAGGGEAKREVPAWTALLALALLAFVVEGVLLRR